jgi:hypothetical protein
MSQPSLPSQPSPSELAVPAPEPASAFTCTRRAESGGSIRLVLAGELDLAVRTPFEMALADA